ncbi:hypothetical protein JK358_10735 [Nocardia sp. 2]|uniref:Lsr2 protein n=1 Tax=Nocardia acididurans TaxID=2802282 RepID=A0ABS1M2H2_9NOCA|nr:hypothetical protein [Nocardia acididurans]MBL1074868.1 hypothetical protein [Nocardia acididurans]
MKFEINQKAMRELEKQLSGTVQVPLDGSESDAIRSVKQQYKKTTGIELDTNSARKIVRQARGN